MIAQPPNPNRNQPAVPVPPGRRANSSRPVFVGEGVALKRVGVANRRTQGLGFIKWLQ